MPAQPPDKPSDSVETEYAPAALVSGAAVALAVSAALAHAVDQAEGRPWHTVMRPFGDAEVFWVTALAALPLTCLLGLRCGAWPRRRWIGLIGLVLISWWTLATHGDIPLVHLDSLTRAVPPALARLSWIIAWQVPSWALAGPAVWPRRARLDRGFPPTNASTTGNFIGPPGGRSTQASPALVSWGAAWLVACAVPWIFAAHRADALHRAVARRTAQQRIWDAWLLSGRWRDLDAWSASAADSHRALTQSLSEISQRTQVPLNDLSAVADRMQRVIDLARLNQLSSAQELVDQLERDWCGGANRPATSAATCGELSRLQADLAARRGDWREAAERSELALQYLRRASARGESPVERVQEVLLVEVAADYWRRARDYERALGVIESARALSPDRAEYAVVLGDHYRLGGQVWRATRAYESVWGTTSPGVGLDVEWTARARAGMDQLVRSTPACLWVSRRP